MQTVGKHSLSVIHVLTYTRNKFITNFYSSETMMVQVTKTNIILCLMVFHSVKSKNDLVFGLST